MRLKGKNVILRTFRIADAENFVLWFNDPKVNRFMKLRKMDLKTEKRYISDRIKGKVKSEFGLAIETIDGQHIGSVGLHLNAANNRATFGIIIGNKAYWGKGLGTEAATMMIDYGFKKLKLHRIDLDVYEYNQRAQKLYRKLGFKKEGLKRQHNLFGGRYHDTVYMGLLKDDWKK